MSVEGRKSEDGQHGGASGGGVRRPGLRTWLPVARAGLKLGPGMRSGRGARLGLSLGLSLGVSLLTAASAWAVSSQQLVHGSPEVLARGELDGVSISRDGVMTLAPALVKKIDLPDPVVWKVAQDQKGNLYFATGTDGKVYQLKAGSARPDVLADFTETQVSSMVVRPDGMVYVGTAPDGKIYRVAEGTPAQPLANPNPRYLWDMLFDGKGNLLVATGSPGGILRVTDAGVIQPVLTTKEEHILSIALDGKGNLYAGSADHGYVYRLDPDKGDASATVLFDAPGNEVKQVLPWPDGSVMALTLGPMEEGATDSPLSGLLAKATGETPASADTLLTRVFKISDPKNAAKGGERGEFRPPELMWQSQGFSGHSLAAFQGALVMGVGEEGKIANIPAFEQEQILADATGEQVTDLTPSANPADGSVWVAVSNPGALFKLGPGLAERGTFTSEVIDSGTFADWGRVVVRQEASTNGSQVGSLDLQTRSGNTQLPDSTWSAWQDAKAQAQNSAGGEGSNSSLDKAFLPDSVASRYLQYRLVFKSGGALGGAGGPRVRQVEVFYLPANQAPVLTELVVMDPDIRVEPKEDFKGDPEPRGINRPKVDSPAPGLKEKEAPGVQAARWTVSDADGDELRYSVALRSLGLNRWRPLASDPTQNFINFPARTIADGWYQLKVTASDAPSNRAETARQTERISPAFPIDHTPPTLAGLTYRLTGRAAQVRLDVQELTTRVVSARYALDGGAFAQMFSDDKVLDEAEERFSFSLGELSVGEHELVVEVADLVGNVATGKLNISIK